TRLIKSAIDRDDDVDAPIVRRFGTSSTARLQFLQLNGPKARNMRGSPIRVFPGLHHISQLMASRDSKERQALRKLGRSVCSTPFTHTIEPIVDSWIDASGGNVGVVPQVPIRIE